MRFSSLFKDGNWCLALPMLIHGVTITAASFDSQPSLSVTRAAVPDPEVDSRPVLRPELPYAKGLDVLALQKMLNAAGLSNSEDQIYGPYTQALVGQFQRIHKLKPDAVVGPQTWSLLISIAATSVL